MGMGVNTVLKTEWGQLGEWSWGRDAYGDGLKELGKKCL